jgi:hypothetical protein
VATIDPFKKTYPTLIGAGGMSPGNVPPPVVGPYKPTGEDAGGFGPVGGRTNPEWAMKVRYQSPAHPITYGRNTDKQGVD